MQSLWKPTFGLGTMSLLSYLIIQEKSCDQIIIKGQRNIVYWRNCKRYNYRELWRTKSNVHTPLFWVEPKDRARPQYFMRANNCIICLEDSWALTSYTIYPHPMGIFPVGHGIDVTQTDGHQGVSDGYNQAMTHWFKGWGPHGMKDSYSACLYDAW